ncbi:cysteine dioxygenase [Alsobacter sp. R-9]
MPPASAPASPILAPFADLGLFGPHHAAAYLDKARATLREALASPCLLDGITLQRQEGSYTRTLLFGDDQVSVFALLWPAGARTSIHDHHCSCCFGVVSGVLTERWFRVVGPGRAAVSATARRTPGFVAAMLPDGPNIHQMVNETSEDAVSIHIYGFDHRRHASSIHAEFEEASQ